MHHANIADISAEETYGHPVENAPWEEIAAICGPYNCSQIILAERAPELGLSLDEARRVGYTIAGGMWHGSTCGCLLAAIVAAGCLDRPEAVPELIRRFESATGAISCPGVLATPTSCGRCIQLGRELVDLLIEGDAGEHPALPAANENVELSFARYTGEDYTVFVPEGITTIGAHAFENNATLNNVVLPRSLKKIGKYAFANCTNLHNVMFSGGIERIGGHAFEGCVLLSTVELVTCCSDIKPTAFNGCITLEKLAVASV